jgi:hypothetical protein
MSTLLWQTRIREHLALRHASLEEGHDGQVVERLAEDDLA